MLESERHEERPGIRTFVVEDTETRKLYVARVDCDNHLHGVWRVKAKLAKHLKVSEHRLDPLWGTLLDSSDVVEIRIRQDKQDFTYLADRVEPKSIE